MTKEQTCEVFGELHALDTITLRGKTDSVAIECPCGETDVVSIWNPNTLPSWAYNGESLQKAAVALLRAANLEPVV